MEHDILGGFIRLHILHHAAHGEVFGLWMIRELARHGYEISPGTMYPMLHGMEKRGYLSAKEKLVKGRTRKVYRATAAGRKALKEAKKQVRELFDELSEGKEKKS